MSLQANDSLSKELNVLDTIEFAYVTGFVKKNPKSPVALYAVREFAKPILNPPDFGSAFQLLDPSLKKTPTGQQIQKLITEANAYQQGIQCLNLSSLMLTVNS